MPSLCSGRWSSIGSFRRRWALVGLVLVAWALRLPPIVDNRLHLDEALYGYWGLLIGKGQDPWLTRVPVYKPPLLPYVVAGTQAIFGDSEFTMRLPGLAAGVLMVPLVAALASALYRDRRVPTQAAICVAMSPFAVLFSATVFPDPLMVVLGLGACVAAARGRPRWSGLLAGLSLAAKQTGLVWVPVALILSLTRVSDLRTLVSRFSTWLLLTVGLVCTWDVVRVTQGAESFWDMGVTGYGGLRLIWSHELWTRLHGWSRLAHYIFVSPIVNGVLLMGLPGLAWAAVRRRCSTREGFADLLLVSFSLAYLVIHWLWAFPTWDRYLLPLMPVLAVLVGRLLSLLAQRLLAIIGGSTARSLGGSSLSSSWAGVVVHSLLLIALVLPALNAANGRYPLGGDHGAHDGIDQVAAFLRDLPVGAVVYHHWLGWHHEYYLFGAPVYLAYWPTPTWLAQDVQAFGGREPRYLAFPSQESSARLERSLAGVGFGLQRALATARRDGAPSLSVYRIVPLSDT